MVQLEHKVQLENKETMVLLVISELKDQLDHPEVPLVKLDLKDQLDHLEVPLVKLEQKALLVQSVLSGWLDLLVLLV
jgi:hypothetical protein